MSETRLRESILTLARAVARDLAKAGEVDIMQRGEVIDPDAQWRGPIRIRARSRWHSAT